MEGEGTGWREGEGVGEEREGDVRFSLSRPANPKAQPMHLSDDAQMLLAREQILTVNT